MNENDTSGGETGGWLSSLNKAWREHQSLRVITAVVFVVLAIIFIYYISRQLFMPLWSIKAIDNAVEAIFVMAILAALASAAWAIISSGEDRPQINSRKDETPRRRAKRLKPLRRWIAVLALLASLYVAYGSFRNQIMISSEAELNSEGMDLFRLEVATPELRCLYYNYGHDDPEACLETIVSDPGLWSLAIFYVEEAWFLLNKAHMDRKKWGSDYASHIAYWADDVSRDPTGLFTYYLVNAEGVDGARAEMDASRVCVPNICSRYNRVRSALETQGTSPIPRDHNPCALPPPSSEASCALRAHDWGLVDGPDKLAPLWD